MEMTRFCPGEETFHRPIFFDIDEEPLPPQDPEILRWKAYWDANPTKYPLFKPNRDINDPEYRGFLTRLSARNGNSKNDPSIFID